MYNYNKILITSTIVKHKRCSVNKINNVMIADTGKRLSLRQVTLCKS